MKKVRNVFFLLIISIFSLSYFIFLIWFSKKNIEIKTINFIGELLTIPILLVTIILFIFSCINVFKEQFKLKYLYFLILIINFISLIILYNAD